MGTVNIFTHYDQKENDFTNGLIAILSLSRFDNPQLVTSFLRDELELVPKGEVDTFRVLRGIQGTADGELRGEDCCVQFETKIVSGTLDSAQIDRHLEKLRARPEVLRRLVLLTPDDSASRYTRQFRSRDTDLILHLGWKRVYSFLERSVKTETPSAFSELVRQFLERIHHTVFVQDMAGVVLKIAFGHKSEVYEDKYLAEMKAGTWTQWDTPRQCKSLDGTGRKLMLYDTKRKGITVEVEIKWVKRTGADAQFPWTNEFAEDPHIFDDPIPLSRIQMVQGFENFGRNRSAFRNITHEQYRKLMGNDFTPPNGRTIGCS